MKTSPLCFWVVGRAWWMGSRGEPTLPSVLGGSLEPRCLVPSACMPDQLVALSLIKSHSCLGPNLGNFVPSMCQSPSCLQDLKTSRLQVLLSALSFCLWAHRGINQPLNPSPTCPSESGPGLPPSSVIPAHTPLSTILEPKSSENQTLKNK